jgi:hypothetical protein
MAAIDGAAWFDYLNWKHSQRERPLPRSHGLYCPRCQYSHPFNGKEGFRLATKFEKRAGRWHIQWLCPRSLDQLAEDIPSKTASSIRPPHTMDY